MMQKETLTKDQIDNFLRDWILKEREGVEEELTELLDGIDNDMISEINVNISSNKENVPEALYDVLMDEGLIEDSEDYRNQFIDYYEERHA